LKNEYIKNSIKKEDRHETRIFSRETWYCILLLAQNHIVHSKKYRHPLDGLAKFKKAKEVLGEAATRGFTICLFRVPHLLDFILNSFGFTKIILILV
jgi:hypothetical protein